MTGAFWHGSYQEVLINGSLFTETQIISILKEAASDLRQIFAPGEAPDRAFYLVRHL